MNERARGPLPNKQGEAIGDAAPPRWLALPQVRSLRPWLATVIEVAGLVLLAAGFGLAWLPLGLIVAGGALVFLARGVES